MAQRRSLARSALVGLSALAGIVTAAPDASAQFAYFVSRDPFDDVDPLIPPRAVAFRLQNRGFRELSRPRFDGTAYIIDATNPSGARVRLFVDARDGAVLGRQPLETAYYPSARPERARPGYGWTEDEAAPRRQARIPDGLVPPASVPDVAPAPRGSEPAPRAGSTESNPYGLNPDGKKSPASTATKKSARLTQPAKPTAARVAPAAPAPKIDAAETQKPDPATATVEPARPAPEPAPTPAANQEPAAEKASPEPAKVEVPKAEPAPATEAKQGEGWQEPPAQEEAKRKVRVIGGATVVPGGAGETPAAGAN